MPRPVKTLIVKPDGSYEEKTLTSLGDFQKAVEGYLEALWFNDYMIYVNEEGLLKRLAPNVLSEYISIPIVGNAVIVGRGTSVPRDVPETIKQAIIDFLDNLSKSRSFTEHNASVCANRDGTFVEDVLDNDDPGNEGEIAQEDLGDSE